MPDWAEWWDDGVKVYLSAEDYENIRVFEPYRLSRIVSIVNNRTALDGGRSVTSVRKNKGYEDLPYIRSKITSRDIVEAVREVLGVKEGEAIPLVFDGKVTPVVVLNDSIKYSNWIYKGYLNVAGMHAYYVDNYGYTYTDNNTVYDKDLNLVGVITNMLGTDYMKYSRNYFMSSDGVSDVNVYYKGILVFNYDMSTVSANFANLIGNDCMSDSGKYYRVHVADAILGELICFFEGVV